MYAVNQPGDAKSFDEKSLKETTRALSWLENSTRFYELFKTDNGKKGEAKIIDRWMKVRTLETVETVTRAMDSYRLFDAARAVSLLAEDLSQWYVRRIRDRAREGDVVALQTLQGTLRAAALLLAPLAPFLAEHVFQMVRSKNDPTSVHLAAWPKAEKSWLAHFSRGKRRDQALVSDMRRVRGLASAALKLRQEANIKLRQPLQTFSVTEKVSEDLETLLAEEINVKEVVSGASEIVLDTKLTPALIEEGDERALARAVAEARKALGLSPRDTARVIMSPEGPYTAELSTGSTRFALHVDAT